MKIRKQILLLFTLSMFTVLKAAEVKPEYAVFLIPDSLKKEAYMVVRSSTSSFEYKSANAGVYKATEVLTVLDKKGKDMSDFRYTVDKFRELKSFTALLYDANGSFLKKFNMSDLLTTEYTDGHTLTDDSKHCYFSSDVPGYPFTIVYEYEVGYKNGILSFPPFVPQEGLHIAVQRASYSISIPEALKYKSKSVNLPQEPSFTVRKNIATLVWEVNGLKAIESENFMGDIENYIPLMFIRPITFVYDNTAGEITDWESMAKWENTLLQNRDILPDDVKAKLIDLVKNAKTDSEKVKILYDYLGETTRYLSVQLGIGGYQPFPALEVNKKGYGDCKALTNYLKAMLGVVGIQSYYTSIRYDEDKKALYSDFPGFNQMNHVILQVPLPGDTLWLECTNTRVPFGFIHNGIAGHDALAIVGEGGRLCRLPDYPDSLNVESYRSEITIKADGSASCVAKKTCKVKIYDDNVGFVYKKPAEQTDDVRKDIHVPNATVAKVTFTEDKSVLPSLRISFDWDASLYGTKTGSRLFIPVNPYRTEYGGIKKKNRVHDIHIVTGFKDVDSITINLPDGFDIESLPAPVVYSNAFGTLSSDVKVENKQLIVRQTVFVKSGQWPQSDYNELISLFDKIGAAYKSKVILRKKDV